MLCQEGAEAWSKKTGNRVHVIRTSLLEHEKLAEVQLILGKHSATVDVFELDMIWPPILAEHFVDLSSYVDPVTVQSYDSLVIDSNTVDGKLIALPWSISVGILYYRQDLLDKYGLPVPETWDKLGLSAKEIVEAEKAGGQKDLTGFVFQGKPYEGLTCNALEWIASNGGGSILAPDGSVTLHNDKAAAAIDTMASWLGTIAPKNVTTHAEEQARLLFQAGNAVFMRNWPYAWYLLNGEGSPVKGKVKIATLPRGTDRDGCDLRFMVASDGNTEDEIIRKFETGFESKNTECVVLIVRATSDSEKWTIAGFNDAGDFRTVVIDDPSRELSVELKKEPINKSRVVELATSSLGRTHRDSVPFATVGGSSLAVSKYSKNPDTAADLVMYLTSEVEQLRRAEKGGQYPTRLTSAHYKKLLLSHPHYAIIKRALANVVARPSSIAKQQYSHVSSIFWNAVYDTLNGKGSGEENLEAATRAIADLMGDTDFQSETR